jgi:hypothetical protein
MSVMRSCSRCGTNCRGRLGTSSIAASTSRYPRQLLIGGLSRGVRRATTLRDAAVGLFPGRLLSHGPGRGSRGYSQSAWDRGLCHDSLSFREFPGIPLTEDNPVTPA